MTDLSRCDWCGAPATRWHRDADLRSPLVFMDCERCWAEWSSSNPLKARAATSLGSLEAACEFILLLEVHRS